MLPLLTSATASVHSAAAKRGMIRRLISFALLLTVPAISHAETTGDAAMPVERIWPGPPPGKQTEPSQLAITERDEPDGLRDRFATGITDPDLAVFLADKPNGTALLVIPGGGYQRVVMDKEGYETARWFAARAVSSFVLRYRLPGESWLPRSVVPLLDAQRAMRWIRGHAGRYGIASDRIGVIGFSAGGHLAGLLATGHTEAIYDAVDDLDRLRARPDFAVLMYPVISMRTDIAHGGSRDRLLGDAPSPEAVEQYSVERRVNAATPALFLLHAADDESVPVENSLRLYDALRVQGIPAELHVFAAGGHGFGLRYAVGQPVSRWPELVNDWIALRASATAAR
jgi:acetyl esterase/lipase